MSQTLSRPQKDKQMRRRASLLLGVVTLFNLLANVVFHITVAHHQSVSGYGQVVTLLSLGTGAAICAAGIQYAVARHVALSSNPLFDQLKQALVSSGIALLPALLLGLLGFVIADYLHLSGVGAVWAAALYFALNIVQAVPFGILIGRDRYGWLAGLTAIGVALRLSLVLVTGHAGSSTVGALGISDVAVATTVIGAALLLVSMSRVPWRADVAPARSDASAVRRDGLSGSLLGTFLWAIWLLPLFFARHYLPGAAAGRFAVAHTAAGAILFLCAPLATAFVPAALRRRSTTRDGLELTALVAALCTLGLCVVGPALIFSLYGPGFAPGSRTLAALGASAGVVSCANYLLWVSAPGTRSRERFLFVVPAAIAAELAVVLAIPVSSALLAGLPAVAIAVGLVSTPVICRFARTGKSGAHIDGEATACLNGVLLSECSVGIMARNEEKTVRSCIQSILEERDDLGGCVQEVIIVISGTDRTGRIVAEIAGGDSRVRLLHQVGIPGKAAAVNLFLDQAQRNILVLSSADVLLGRGMLKSLVAPLADPDVGMCGGEIRPTNPRRGLGNRLVHLVWELHAMVARRHPKLGEIVAFRRCFDGIDERSWADEVSIEALVSAAGLSLQYIPDVLVYNHGPTRPYDFLRHRLRIHLGHAVTRQK
jgi:O-antigen/teichoic acid export membrane protein